MCLSSISATYPKGEIYLLLKEIFEAQTSQIDKMLLNQGIILVWEFLNSSILILSCAMSAGAMGQQNKIKIDQSNPDDLLLFKLKAPMWYSKPAREDWQGDLPLLSITKTNWPEDHPREIKVSSRLMEKKRTIRGAQKGYCS